MIVGGGGGGSCCCCGGSVYGFGSGIHFGILHRGSISVSSGGGVSSSGGE